MKLKQITLAIFSAAIFSSCATQQVFPGFEETAFVDYSLFHKNGIQVYDGEVPEGGTPIGRLIEYVRFTRIYRFNSFKVDKKDKKDTGNDDIIVPKYKTIITSNSDHIKDIERLTTRISDLVKEKGGKGIANLKISVTNADTQPIFHVSGTVYK